MDKKFTDQLLDRPSFYNLVQDLLVPGSKQLVINQIHHLLNKLPKVDRLLDIGCGPKSWLWQIEEIPIGLDLSYSYCKAYQEVSASIVNGSSIFLPFANDTFGGVWSIGMIHHLPDQLAKQAIEEMIRVSGSHGYVVIFDAVLPAHLFNNPLAYIIRKADRGRYVRSQKDFEALLPNPSIWSIKREKYSLNGLEILVCSNYTAISERK